MAPNLFSYEGGSNAEVPQIGKAVCLVSLIFPQSFFETILDPLGTIGFHGYHSPISSNYSYEQKRRRFRS